MSQQALDLRRSIKIVRRRKFLVSIVAMLGLLGGVASLLLSPPMLTGTALVALPVAAAASAQGASLTGDGAGTTTYMATQVVVASSDPVLSGALPHISPAVSLATLRNRIQVKSLTVSILSISGNGKTAAQA
jgi:uncharacterized protein involved in exopolysaccharide biosynthesis